MPSNRVGALVALAVGLCVSGCDTASFGGSSDKPKAPAAKSSADATKTKDAQTLPGTPSTSPSGTAGDPDSLGQTAAADDENLSKQVVIPPDCDPTTGATQARLLTTSIQNGSPSAYLEYEIFLTDCDGQIRNLQADKIWFDLDGHSVFDPLNFSLKGVTDQTGLMTPISGTDLFGHKGLEWGHWETAQPVSVATNAQSVVIHISMPNDIITSYSGGSGLSTFLRFGNAAPVTTVVQLL